MATLDIILLSVIALGVVLGFLRGALKQLASLLGLVVGLLAARALYASVAERVFSHVTDTPSVAQLLSFVAIWLAVPLLFWLAATLLTKMMEAVSLGWLNRLLGAVLGGLLRPAQPRSQTPVCALRPPQAPGRTLPARRARIYQTNL